MHPFDLGDFLFQPTERPASRRFAIETGDEEDAGGRDDFGRVKGATVLPLGIAAVQFFDRSAARWAATKPSIASGWICIDEPRLCDGDIGLVRPTSDVRAIIDAKLDAEYATTLYLPITWLLYRFRPGRAKSREFTGETGLEGFTTLNIPAMIDRSANGAPQPGSACLSASCSDTYSAKVR
jgi:hypothetical protein